MLGALSVCALLMVPVPAGAQPQPEPKETVIRLTIYPAAEPRPALKYQLLPTLDEMNPGNPILGYLKCFPEQHNFFHSKQAVEQREKWLDMPFKDLPAKEMRDYGGTVVARANYAARLTTPDWETLIPLKRDNINLLLPEVQQMRELIGVLKVRFRGEVADGRLDDALVTAKTMFAMSRHFQEHPSLIGNLVGFALGHISTDPLEEMIQQPGCPNLFWALTDLPTPLVSLHRGAQGERYMWRLAFDVLNEKRAMTAEELEAALARGQELLNLVPQKQKVLQQGVKAWVNSQVQDPAALAAAHKRLVEAGLSETAVKTFPPTQVILLDEKKALEVVLDNGLKSLQLPYWQAERLFAEAAKERTTHMDQLWPLFSPFTPQKVREAQVRLEQRLAVLRHIEALRMYAADHQGKLPATLADIKLPLPADPVTSRPFSYSLDGTTATLRGGAPPGRETGIEWNKKYVITVAGK